MLDKEAIEAQFEALCQKHEVPNGVLREALKAAVWDIAEHLAQKRKAFYCVGRSVQELGNAIEHVEDILSTGHPCGLELSWESLVLFASKRAPGYIVVAFLEKLLRGQRTKTGGLGNH